MQEFPNILISGIGMRGKGNLERNQKSMKTKKLFIIGSLTILTLIAHSQELQITFRVVDDFDKPVSGASVNLFTYQITKPGEGFGEDVYKKVTGTTDTDGMVTLEGSSSHYDIKYGVATQPGYYYTEPFGYQFKQSQNGKWQPWNPVVGLVFRPIVKPVPMYARKVETRIAQPAQAYGYDLLAGDWVAPYGKGKTADVFFELTGYANSVKDYDTTLTISFTNALDGIQPFEAIKGSAFRSPRKAPVDAYQSSLELRRVRKPGQWSPSWVDDTTGETNYFFRVRTVLDENGKIKSTLYGKIYGSFKFFGASTNGSFLTIPAYYLNPEPNVRNMEFDPKQNLFKNLKNSEQISAP